MVKINNVSLPFLIDIDWLHVGSVIFASSVSANINKETPAATRLIDSIDLARRPFPGKQTAFVTGLD
jgi:hypothetical protein